MALDALHRRRPAASPPTSLPRRVCVPESGARQTTLPVPRLLRSPPQGCSRAPSVWGVRPAASASPGGPGGAGSPGDSLGRSRRRRCSLLRGLFIPGSPQRSSGLELLCGSFLGAFGQGAKVCSLKEMFNKDTGASNCLFFLAERWRDDVPGNWLPGQAQDGRPEAEPGRGLRRPRG